MLRPRARCQRVSVGLLASSLAIIIAWSSSSSASRSSRHMLRARLLRKGFAVRGRAGRFRAFSSQAPPVPAAGVATELKRYDPAEIEPRWQKIWAEEKTFKTPERRDGKEKRYILDMFPYPSGAGLHVGHPEGYTASDVMARYYRMKDYDVLHPMGWDSFGLPAEQHAINTGTHPAVTTLENIANFKRQLSMLGFSYDWDREIATTDIRFVKWTQWIFLQLYKQGLATQSEVSVNWCPALGTVLANEEVINGKSERGDHPVKRLPLRQWVLKITEYADKLIDDLDGLNWPEGTLTAQRTWIGRSEGAEIEFNIQGHDESLSVFTTRPDTLMGVTYVCIAPEHPLAKTLPIDADHLEKVSAYVEETSSKSDVDRTAAAAKEKTGVDTGAKAIHPITGEEIPIWVADYVLGSYGSGAVMAVPAHDERDFAFADKFGLPRKEVVQAPPAKNNNKNNKNNNNNNKADVEDEKAQPSAFTGEGKLVNSGEFDGLKGDKAKAKIIEKLEAEGKGRRKIQYKLRDWIFSRQRYWGEPIPIYFPVNMADPNGDPRKGDEHTIDYQTPIPVPEEELPLQLPEMDNFQPGDDPQGCLARAADWRYFLKDGKWYARETNTMPQWAGSCWYYLRFIDPLNDQQPFSKQADDDWMPVDLYVGGQEHATLHLLYARFWHKVLYEAGLTKTKEPFQKLVHQGMILGTDGEKMSKSRGNVVNPDDVVNEHGADSLRLYEMFMGPLEATKPWQTSQVSGVVRFRDKVYALATRGDLQDTMDEKIEKAMHKCIKKVTEDVESMSFNTAISAMMVFTNTLQDAAKEGMVPRKAVETLALLVSPFAPHLGEECWKMLGHEDSLAFHPWPEYDEALCVESTVTIGVQVNGKLRGQLEIEKDAPEDKAKEAAMAIPGVEQFAGGKEMKKFIYRPGKIINIVVAK